MLFKNKFLQTMAEIGFVHPDKAETSEAGRAFPKDVALPSTDLRNKTVIFFHDESTTKTSAPNGVKKESSLKVKGRELWFQILWKRSPFLIFLLTYDISIAIDTEHAQ